MFMGEDSLGYSALLLGAEGMVSGPSGVFPEPYVHLYRAFRDKNYEEARKQQMIINSFFRKVQEGLNLDRGQMFYFYKKALEVRGIDVGGVRDPLPTLDASKRDLITRLVKEFLQNEHIDE